MPKAGDCSGGGRRDLPLLFLRVGAAITLSIAGLFFSRLRWQRRPRPRHLLLPPPSEPDDARGIKGGGGGLKDELRILKNEDTKAKIISGNSVHTTTTTTTTTTTASVSLPPKCRNIDDDDDGFLLPEFNEMIMEEFGGDIGNIASSPAARVREDASNEHEIFKLRDLVRSLQEREKTLEIQLLELYGLQEQGAAVRELENQLKINNVESKLYSLKIESLQSENQRLQTQLSESSKLTSQLEITKSKCKLLKRNLRLDAEQAKEKIASLQNIVDSFHCQEITEGEVDGEAEKKLKRLEELENEATELRAANSRLQQENSHLIRRLEHARAPKMMLDLHSDGSHIVDGNWKALGKLLIYCNGCMKGGLFGNIHVPGHFVFRTRFSRTAGKSFLPLQCRMDVLYVSDPCEHLDQGEEGDLGFFRGIFKSFATSRVKKILIEKQARFHQTEVCPYCKAKLWNMLHADMMPASASARLGAYDDSVEYFVCLNGHVIGLGTLLPLSDSEEAPEE